VAARVPGVRQAGIRVDRFVRSRADEAVAGAQAQFRGELDLLARRLETRLDDQLADLRRRLDEATALLAEHDRSRHEHWARLGSVSDEVGRLRFDVDRMVPVVAALEARVEKLHQDAVPPSVPPLDEASSADFELHLRHLLDEVRREHAQVRARMSVVAAYEERLRRLEDG
jgi:chromosome segregation ATPase